MQALGTAVPYPAHAFGFDIRRAEDDGRGRRRTAPATSSATRSTGGSRTTASPRPVSASSCRDRSPTTRQHPAASRRTEDATGRPRPRSCTTSPARRDRRRPESLYMLPDVPLGARRRWACPPARAARQGGAGVAAPAVVLVRRRRAARASSSSPACGCRRAGQRVAQLEASRATALARRAPTVAPCSRSPARRPAAGRLGSQRARGRSAQTPAIAVAWAS